MASWVPVTRGEGSVKSLQPFDGCGKAELFKRDARKKCTRWIRAAQKPHLWTAERIAAACAHCSFWVIRQEQPLAVAILAT